MTVCFSLTGFARARRQLDIRFVCFGQHVRDAPSGRFRTNRRADPGGSAHSTLRFRAVGEPCDPSEDDPPHVARPDDARTDLGPTVLGEQRAARTPLFKEVQKSSHENSDSEMELPISISKKCTNSEIWSSC